MSVICFLSAEPYLYYIQMSFFVNLYIIWREENLKKLRMYVYKVYKQDVYTYIQSRR